jgi:hypothetical protein
MKTLGAAVMGTLILAGSGSSSEADFLLNCRLMERDHPWYDRYCKGELGYLNKLIEECPPEAACISCPAGHTLGEAPIIDGP